MARRFLRAMPPLLAASPRCAALRKSGKRNEVMPRGLYFCHRFLNQLGQAGAKEGPRLGRREGDAAPMKRGLPSAPLSGRLKVSATTGNDLTMQTRKHPAVPDPLSKKMTQQGREAWFALRVKPRHEKSVSLALNMKGYQEFLPLYTAKHRWSDRYKEVKQPLFAGYTFCYFDPERRLPVLQTAGVSAIVGFGNGPVAVDEQEIEAVQAIIQSGLSAEPYPDIEVGDTVRLKDGPLCGLEGVLTQYRDSDRLVVSVTLLKRSVAVEIDRAWVDRGSKRAHARGIGRG